MTKIISLLFFLKLSLAFSSDFNIGLMTSPNSLNPLHSRDANAININRLVFESLVDFNRKMELTCQLCKDFKLIQQNGRFEIRFNLKQNTYFSDGEKFTAKHIKNVLDIYQSEKEKSIFRYAFQKIKGVKVYNPHKIGFFYSSYSISHLSDLPLLKIFKIRKGDFISTSDYKIVSKKAFEIKLKNIKTGKLINFKVVRDETTMVLKLLKGEIDLIANSLGERKYKYLEKSGQYRFFKTTGANLTYLSFNLKRVLKNRLLRQAVFHAIPLEMIIREKYKGHVFKSAEIFSEAFSHLNLGFKSSHQYDPALSKSILKRSNNIGTVLDWKISTNKKTLEIANILKHYLEEVGFTVKLSQYEWGSLRKMQNRLDFDLIIGNIVGFTDTDIAKFLFHSTSSPPNGLNRFGLELSQVDRMTEALITDISLPKKRALLNDLYKTLENDYLFFPLWSAAEVWVGKRCLNDLQLYPNGSFQALRNIEVSQCYQ